MMPKRNLFLRCLLGLLMLPAWSFSQFLAWDYHNIITDERFSGAYPDMAVDPSGRIHVSYWNQEEDRLMYIHRGAGDTAWTREYVDVTKPNGFRSAITLDSDSRPHVAYQENQNGMVKIGYAYKDSSDTWVLESLPGDPVKGWGEYGPSASVNTSLRLKHSLDIVLNESGDPQIVFFDAWSDISAFIPCNTSSNYKLKLYQGIRQSPGTWTTRSFGVIPDVQVSCGSGLNVYAMPLGDRYGEYCQLLQRSDDKMQVFCLSRFNNDMLNFINDSTSVDTIWTPTTTDHRERILPNWGWADRYFTIEGVGAAQDPAGKIHLSYTTSLFFGENFFAGSLASNEMVYSRIIDDTTIYYYNFGTGTYRNYTNITTQGNDSIYIVYSNLSTQQFLLKESTDGGITWADDTLRSGIGSYYSPTTIFGDSLVVVFFDESVEKLFLGKRALSGGNWRLEIINESENHGTAIDAYIHTTATDTQFVTVFNDSYNGSLKFSEASTSNGITFSNTLVSEEDGPVMVAALARTSFGMNLIAYAGGTDRMLKLAKGSPGNWGFEVVDSAGSVAFADIQVSALDTIHIAYYASDDSCLKYAKRHVFGSTWLKENIQCDSLRTGQFPSMQLDASGRPHIAYHSVVDKALMYTRRDGMNQNWVFDTVHVGTSSAIGKFASLRLDAAGLPKIAYLDEQQTALWLAEMDNGGLWQLSMVDSVPVTNLGRPIDMEIDSYGKVWIAYNHYTNFEKVKLLHRDSVWREVAVSTTGQMADAFAFRIVDGSLNLFGKKNALQNTGVAFLRSSNGVHVSSEPSMDLDEWMQVSTYPNPFSAQTEIQLMLKQPLSLSISCFDLMGKEILTVSGGQKMAAGQHSFVIDGGHIPAGVYLLVIRSEKGSMTKRLIRTP